VWPAVDDPAFVNSAPAEKWPRSRDLSVFILKIFSGIDVNVNQCMTATAPTWLNIVFMRWTAVFIWMVIIFILSTDTFSSARTQSISIPPIAGFLIRKLAHWTEYFILAALLMRTMAASPAGFKAKRHLLSTVILAVLYAISDEGHQSFVGSRDARASDVLIDAIGAICGALWFYTHVAVRQVKTVHANT
jgi:VanZ like family